MASVGKTVPEALKVSYVDEGLSRISSALTLYPRMQNLAQFIGISAQVAEYRKSGFPNFANWKDRAAFMQRAGGDPTPPAMRQQLEPGFSHDYRKTFQAPKSECRGPLRSGASELHLLKALHQIKNRNLPL